MTAEAGAAPPAALGEIWTALHKDEELVICGDELHYLTMVALSLDEDLISCLLLRKLRMATNVPAAELPASRVRMNAFLEYSYDGGGARLCQIVHPGPFQPSYGLSVRSRLGAGLIGLGSGQSVLWPNRAGRLRELHVHRVVQAAPTAEAAAACGRGDALLPG